MAKQNVVFLCTGNSARSLMAEALLRHRAADLFSIYSAGVRPRGINPLTSRVLREIGVETCGLRSKGLSELPPKLCIDYLIIVCDAADRACPAGFCSNAKRVLWRIEDPSKCEDTDDDPLDRFREIRDEIDERIAAWVRELSQCNAIVASFA